MTLRDKIKKNFFLPLIKLKYILKGFGTYLPGSIGKYFPQHQNQFYNRGCIRQHPVTSRACYSLWLRHLVTLFDKKVSTQNIKTIAELGVGDSLGVGLAALLTGANKFYALDITENAFTASNLDIFDELVFLFRNKSSIPNDKEFPKIRLTLKTYRFPDHILTDNYYIIRRHSN